jgi:hypothetical protein
MTVLASVGYGPSARLCRARRGQSQRVVGGQVIGGPGVLCAAGMMMVMKIIGLRPPFSKRRRGPGEVKLQERDAEPGYSQDLA